jgi:hypothetical protein
VYLTAVRVFDVLAQEALATRETPFGSVGTLYSDGQIEAVWVSKHVEAVDPDWFTQGAVDLIVVLQGRLRIEFADPEHEARTLEPGNVLVLPPATKCRAYRWPRTAESATVFVAVYPRRPVRGRTEASGTQIAV